MPGPFLLSTATEFGITPTNQQFVSPLQRSDVWDTFVIQGVAWIGKFEIRQACHVQHWDPKQARGQEGNEDSYVGSKPREFDVTFFLWAQPHFDLWPVFSAPLVYSGEKNRASPCTVYHPSLALIGISAVVCLELGAVLPVSSGSDMYHAAVKIRQFRPAVTSPVTTPKGVTPSKTTTKFAGFVGPLQETALEKAQTTLAQRQAQAANLQSTLPGKGTH
jgi:hypothetical protein